MSFTSLLLCFSLLTLSIHGEDGVPQLVAEPVPLVAEPVLFADTPFLFADPVPVLISEPACCDPLTRPDGNNGNPICFEGSACCPDGTWSCSIGDGKTFPCGGVQLQNPQGTICGAPPPSGDECCDPGNFPLCLIGNAACCPSGTWACPNGDSDSYPCDGTFVTDPQGQVCDKESPLTVPPTNPPTKKWKYSEPEWWDLISETFEGDTKLKRCRRRQFPPQAGTKCPGRSKTCFFGNQKCDGVGAYPEIQCDCKQRMWTCDEVECPGSEPITTQGSCPYNANNSPDCPATNPLDFSGSNAICESASLIGETCRYGEESCCGNCFASFFCSCFEVGEGFGCGYTDACFGAPCIMADQEAAWDLLVGTVCDPDAINAILADYPGMEVLCIPEGSFVTADFSINRVRIFFDPATGLVSVPPRVG